MRKPLPFAALSLTAALALAAPAQAALSTSFSSGTLTINGDGAHDSITLSCSNADLSLNGNATGQKCQFGALTRIVINSGAGNDYVHMENVNQALAQLNISEIEANLGAGTDTYNAPQGAVSVADDVDGGPDNDTIITGSLADRVTGGSGHNTIDAGTNGNAMIAEADVAEEVGGSANNQGTVLTFGANSSDITGAETLDYTGDDSPNTIDLLSFNGRVVLDGKGGADILTTGGGDDDIYGGTGNDTISSLAGDDSVGGGGGQDTLNGGADDDDLNIFSSTAGSSVIGGSGNDTLKGTPSLSQTLTGGTGTDTAVASGNGALTAAAFGSLTLGSVEHAIITGSTVDASAFPGSTYIDAPENTPANLKGAQGTNTLKGSLLEDTIVGGPLADTIEASSGSDLVTGAGGADTIDGGGDPIIGDTLVETVSGNVVVTPAKLDAATDDTLTGIEDVKLTGSGGADTIDASAFGAASKVTLLGLGGNDTLTGGQGGDLLDAGAGVDTLKGGSGADVLKALNTEQTTLDCGAGTDSGDRDFADTATGCENLTVGAAPAGNGGGGSQQGGGTPAPGAGPQLPAVQSPGTGQAGLAATATPGAGVTLVTAKSLKLKKGAITVKLVCGPARCAGIARLTVRGKVVAKASYVIAAKGSKRITLRLTKAGLKQLRAKGSLRGQITAGAAKGGVLVKR